MQDNKIRWAISISIGLGCILLLVALSFAWVAIYSHLINPGHDITFYQEYAERASPVVGIGIGLPLYFFVCRSLAARSNFRTAVVCWAVSGTLTALALAVSDFSKPGTIACLIDLPLKWGVSYLGSRHGAARNSAAGINAAASAS